MDSCPVKSFVCFGSNDHLGCCSLVANGGTSNIIWEPTSATSLFKHVPTLFSGSKSTLASELESVHISRETGASRRGGLRLRPRLFLGSFWHRKESIRRWLSEEAREKSTLAGLLIPRLLVCLLSLYLFSCWPCSYHHHFHFWGISVPFWRNLVLVLFQELSGS